MTSCSDEHEALQSTDQTSTVVQASVSAFKVDGEISSVAGENEINDIQACLFENGLMTAVYSNLDQTSDSYSLKLKSMSGTLYMLANTADLIDLQQMKESGNALKAHGVAEDIGIFMTLAFVSLPVIPKLRLNTYGIIDVAQQKVVPAVF